MSENLQPRLTRSASRSSRKQPNTVIKSPILSTRMSPRLTNSKLQKTLSPKNTGPINTVQRKSPAAIMKTPVRTPARLKSPHSSKCPVPPQPSLCDGPKVIIPSDIEPLQQASEINANIEASCTKGKDNISPKSTTGTKRPHSPADTTLDKEQPQSKKKKKKRRSTFVRGRISQVPPGTSSSELCLNIPNDLPDEERLHRFLQKALHHTMERLGDEFRELDGIEKFKAEGIESTESLLEKLRHDGLLSQATTKDRFLPNPANVAIEEKIHQGEEVKDRCLAEATMWDDLVRKFQESATQAERLDEDGEHRTLHAEPAGLTNAQKNLLKGRLDLNEIITSINRSQQELALMAGELTQHLHVLNSFKMKAESFVKDQTKLLISQTEADIRNDVRHTIQQIAS